MTFKLNFKISDFSPKKSDLFSYVIIVNLQIPVTQNGKEFCKILIFQSVININT